MELRETIINIILKSDNWTKQKNGYGDIETTETQPKVDQITDQILAKIQPLIDEARKEQRKDDLKAMIEELEKILDSPNNKVAKMERLADELKSEMEAMK